jgi:hypothetical protein
MKKIFGVIALLASPLGIQAAHADGASAHKAYFSTLYAQGFEVANDARITVARDTLVNGVYRLSTKDGNQFRAFITETGQIFGDANNGWMHTGTNKPLTNEERAIMRVETLHNIATNKMIKVQYGDGGGRRMILHSSLDCPFCAKMENNLAQYGRSLNTTFYVFPSGLNERDNTSQNLQVWDNAAKVYCAEDSGAAWKEYWAKKRVPPGGQCPVNGPVAKAINKDFREILQSVGIRMHGSPAVIREDGQVFTPPPQTNAAQMQELYGSDALKEVNDVYKMERIPLQFLGRQASR